MKRHVMYLIFTLTALTGYSAHASLIDATFWSVPASTADNVPTLGNAPGPGATEWGTFNASNIEFSGDANYTLGGFLNSFGVASNINYMNGAGATTNLSNVLFEFTGTAYVQSGTTFSVLHDDGVNMYVDGSLVLGVPGLTPPSTNTYTYTGPTGDENFDFIYANGPPTQADFQTTLVSDLVSPTPEPSAYILLLTGVAALWFVRRKIVVTGWAR